MVAINTLALLALAGTISAAPTQTVGQALERRWSWGQGRPQGNWNGGDGHWRGPWGGDSSDSSDADSSAQPTATAAAQPAATPDTANQTPTTSSGGSGGYGSSGSSSNAAPSAAASTPASSAPASSGGASGGLDDYMGIVSEWRSKMGLPDLAQDSTLQGNAQKTSDDSGGQLKHELNPGSMAQVLAPGNSGNFESVFVGGWLCELPSLPGLGASVCNSASQGWDHDGQTGHAEILSSTTYTKIGCALGDGIWACDLA